jgi:hypothetical protein
MISNRKAIALDLREISEGKYSLVLHYEAPGWDHNQTRAAKALWERQSVIFSTHDRDFAVQQAHLYASQYNVPLTITLPV